jgi:hypothetical protein
MATALPIMRPFLTDRGGARLRNRPYDCAPEHVKPQYEKAWLATFPLGFLPTEEGFKDGKFYVEVLTIDEWKARKEHSATSANE